MEEKRLSIRFRDFDQCAKDALTRLYTDDGYREVCAALCFELDEINRMLAELIEQYQEELPLDAEEEKGIDWLDILDTIGETSKAFETKKEPQQADATKVLINSMATTCELLTAIEEAMTQSTDHDIFVSLGKRELAEYVKFKWNRASRDLRYQTMEPTSAHRDEAMQAMMHESQEALHSEAEYILSNDDTTIYYEGLGRHIWRVRHQNEGRNISDETLYRVKCLEILADKIGKQLIYLDKESSPSEEADENIRLKNLRDETVQTQLPKVRYRLGRCEKYLCEGFTVEWIERMLQALIDSEHSAKVCDKMKARKFVKFTHQLAGVLKDEEVFVDCSNGELVEAIAFTKLSRQTGIDYVRHKIDDAKEIERWIVNYIKEYRDGCVNVNR